jgi:hypothetical protein
MFTYDLSDFLYTCLGSLKVVFLLQEYILKVHGSCLF